MDVEAKRRTYLSNCFTVIGEHGSPPQTSSQDWPISAVMTVALEDASDRTRSFYKHTKQISIFTRRHTSGQ
jgi:hypothetical protein